MAQLRQNPNGSYSARKRLPDDVREDYGRLYGPRYEAKFSAPVGTKRQDAERQFHEWKAETDTRIGAIRAQRKGEGVSLTRQQTRALAGEWYEWFVARHPLSDKEKWEHLRDDIHEAMREAVGDDVWETNNPDDLWRDDENFTKAIRPVLADAGETAQFLAMKAMVLDNPTRDQFLDILYDDLSAALKRLMREADGDYSPDEYRKRFPKFEVSGKGETPAQLFDRWVAERQPSQGTIESWQYVFREMEEHFKDRSAASIKYDEAKAWIDGLVNPKRSRHTVSNNWLNASATVFGWAVEHRLIPRNPFAEIPFTVPKKKRLRDTQAFHEDEQRKILRAALEISDTTKPDDAAKRWVPWLCAYTGARVGEIAQLRKSDIIERGGIPAIHITPEAGTVKGGDARTVPLHAHLIEQGFLRFVAEHAEGPLFYKPRKKRGDGSVSDLKKPPYAQVRQRLAAWVRKLGIADKELQPNHA